jgi:hypothetical protein
MYDTRITGRGTVQAPVLRDSVRSRLPSEHVMPAIRPSGDLAFDPEHVQVMLTAFDAACAKLDFEKATGRLTW